MRYWAGDNISAVIRHEGDKEELIDDATVAFEGVLDALVIDRLMILIAKALQGA